MNSELIVRGQVLSQKESSFEGRTSHSVQLMMRNGKGVASIINVKLAEDMDRDRFKEGASVELAVEVNAFENAIYYKAYRDLKAKPDLRAPAPKLA